MFRHLKKRHRQKTQLSMIAVTFLLLCSCTGLPEGIEPVTDFDSQRYIGTWFEIARLDHSFERGLSNVSANYQFRADGGIDVLNKGLSIATGEWDEAKGKAYFVGDETIGHLKVSFFGPFFGSYVVFKLDSTDYQYAYVTSYNREFLWLLSRTPMVTDTVKSDFLRTVETLGFNVDDIIYVSHEPFAPPNE